MNYDMFAAYEASSHFKASFSAATFPTSVTGNLGQQLETTEKMLELGLTFARDLSLECYGLDGLSTSSGRRKSQRGLARMKSPSVEPICVHAPFVDVEEGGGERNILRFPVPEIDSAAQVWSTPSISLLAAFRFDFPCFRGVLCKCSA